MPDPSIKDAEIAQEVQKDGLRIVRLAVNPPEKNNRNVIALDIETGDEVWQIEPISTIYDDSPYTNIAIKDDRLMAFNWDGSNVTVDWKTGSIVERLQGK